MKQLLLTFWTWPKQIKLDSDEFMDSNFVLITINLKINQIYLIKMLMDG